MTDLLVYNPGSGAFSGAPLKRRPRRAPPLCTLTLEQGRSDAAKGVVIRLGQRFILGRGKDVTITVEDTHVSRKHVALELIPEGLRIEDLNSQNGTFLSEQRLPPGTPLVISSADRLRIGRHLFRIELSGLGTREGTRSLRRRPSLPGYQLLGRIGSGATSLVHSAIETATGRRVAIKSLRTHLEDSEWRERILREGGVGLRISSPHVVRTYELIEDETHVHLVMELVHGPALADILDKTTTPFPIAKTLLIGEDVATGLDAIHAEQVVHRDVKPGNIMISANGIAKLTDLGIAKDLRSAATGLTERWTGLGSLGYISPEQASDASRVDHRSDLFGLGATLYRMVTGKLTVPPGPDLMYRIMNPQSVHPCELREDCPDEVGLFLLCLLAKEAHERPSSALDVSVMLRSLREQYYPHYRPTRSESDFLTTFQD